MYEPLQDYILIKKVVPAVKIGSIVLPESAQPKNHGEVISVGPGARLQDGTIVPVAVSVGDVVIYNKAIEFEGGLMLTRESELLCKVK